MRRTGRNTSVTHRAVTMAAAIATVVVVCVGCQTPESIIATHSDDPFIVIETANFGEVELIGAIITNAMTRVDYRVSLRSQSGTQTEVVDAVANGEADLTIGFTGALLSRFNPSATATSSEEVYADMMASLPDGVTAADASPADDSPAYIVSSNTSQVYGLQTMSDLTGQCENFRLGARPEVLADTDLLAQLGQGYQCYFSERQSLPAHPREVTRAVQDGQVGVGIVQSVDPILSMTDVVVLNDDAEAIRAHNVVPIYAKGSVSEPQLELINRIMGELRTEDLQELLRGIEFGTGSPAALANYWLDNHGY